ncbi:uncharacterized protein [Cardiocondyla obscurior]|uniref:uncharacterized protein n=1 Tax=Cardiocondyla obscurior TaxID=286306 RepID=UPI00396568BA
MALRRLISLERKLRLDPTLMVEYTRIINEYKELGHMSLVENFDKHGYYMPHHAVMKASSNTTKVRVVFDASAKTNNKRSLNDILMVGPTIQDKLVAHLIRFRTYIYVISSDIEKMYRQIWLNEKDRHYQRILWREDGKIKTFQLNTLTFGVSSSPYVAIRTIQKLADDERHSYPRAADILQNHMYVDDLLTGANSIEETRAIRDDVIALLKRGGFTIRQWASNDLRVINDLSNEVIHKNLTLKIDQALKTLGVSWNTRDDRIYYSADSIKINKIITKREILSQIARIFDPMGLLGPVVLYAKKMMQDVWRTEIHWDESVPQSIYTEWTEFTRQLKDIHRVSFERKILIKDYRNTQIHGFCDASTHGYGACLYLRSIDKNGKIMNRLICSKSRVAPLKTISIPRLELCGALLLARLFSEIIKTINLTPNRVIFWCDSTIVLHQIKTAPHLLKTYVANRVSEISNLVSSAEWKYIRSKGNPADAISRGQTPHVFLQNKMWQEGPPWLTKNENEWPSGDYQAIDIPELKTNTCLVITYNEPILFQRFSSFSKLCRIIAYCLRFKLKHRYTGALCADEINEAETRIIKIVQNLFFALDIKKLSDTRSQYNGKFVNLNPFLDDQGLMRVGGRLQLSNLNFTQKHPLLLPSRYHLTDKLIRETHERNCHAGIQTTLYILRRKYWLLDGRNQVRKVIRSCMRCHRFTAKSVQYKMGNLPAVRVREAIPFSNTGIDFCGPFFIKEKKYRNRTRIKVYVCVFVCMTIKAIHFELVSDLTTEGFMAALRRFVARRGLPENIYSDNGTNFIGANNELRELYALFNSDEHRNSLNNYASDHRVAWHFIPPAAPHFGGLWESTVKLFKHHLKRVVGDSLFTFEELNTFIIEIEGVLNSRPITAISSDPNDPLALSPAHYLVGRPITALPETDFKSVPANKLSVWQHIIKVRQDFWAKWNMEYLNELQKRVKWTKDGPKVEVGAVVLIKDKNMPCTQWLLGRIKLLHTGEDGTTRAATITTKNGELKRTTKCICPLPIEK